MLEGDDGIYNYFRLHCDVEEVDWKRIKIQKEKEKEEEEDLEVFAMALQPCCRPNCCKLLLLHRY